MPPEKQNHATEEDIALFKKTEDEIRADVSVLSFNVETLKKRIRDEDPAQAIIQAHLHLDHVVSQMLSEAVPSPGTYSLTAPASTRSFNSSRPWDF